MPCMSLARNKNCKACVVNLSHAALQSDGGWRDLPGASPRTPRTLLLRAASEEHRLACPLLALQSKVTSSHGARGGRRRPSSAPAQRRRGESRRFDLLRFGPPQCLHRLHLLRRCASPAEAWASAWDPPEGLSPRSRRLALGARCPVRRARLGASPCTCSTSKHPTVHRTAERLPARTPYSTRRRGHGRGPACDPPEHARPLLADPLLRGQSAHRLSTSAAPPGAR
mmetsp:Transcript_11048/g.33596  ORF Transcript_11048/g.33596 Transcript_11048/m.33596 type:complete len:226 (-) Transcript_11048:746-1423(-)